MTELLDKTAAKTNDRQSEPISAELAELVDRASDAFVARMLAEFDDELPKGVHPLSVSTGTDLPSKV